MMVASARLARDVVTVRLQKRRLTVQDLDQLQNDLHPVARDERVKSIVLDMGSVDFVDNSLINLLKCLTRDTERVGKHFRLQNAPTELKFALSAPSFRMAWASRILPVDSSAPSIRSIAHRPS
jgi:anti-anti-sigma regulatory factor